MFKKMLLEKATVVAFEAGVATVKCQSKQSCSGCSAQSSCGTSALSELTGEQHTHFFSVKTITPVSVGQQVEIGIPERSFFQSVIFIYLIPLCAILISTFLGNLLFSHELMTALFIFIVTAITFLIIRFCTKKYAKQLAYQVILVRVLG